jgi:hypothetical protein
MWKCVDAKKCMDTEPGVISMEDLAAGNFVWA